MLLIIFTQITFSKSFSTFLIQPQKDCMVVNMMEIQFFQQCQYKSRTNSTHTQMQKNFLNDNNNLEHKLKLLPPAKEVLAKYWYDLTLFTF